MNPMTNSECLQGLELVLGADHVLMFVIGIFCFVMGIRYLPLSRRYY